MSEQRDSFKYRAFLSYSQTADRELAPALQSGLQRITASWRQLRAIHVYRDETDIPTTSALLPKIKEALRDSEYFILLASPLSAVSPWVRIEVDYWLSLYPIDKFLIVLTEGEEPVWDQAARDFLWNQNISLPSILMNRFKEEPKFTDLRWARAEKKLKLRERRFYEAVADLASTLRGVDKSTLVGEDARQLRKNRRLASSAVVALFILLLAASAAAAVAFNQRNKARTNAEEAQRNQIEAERQKEIAQDNLATALANEKEAKRQQGIAEQRRKETEQQRQIAETRRQEAVRNAEKAFSRELASNAKSQLDVNTELGALIAVEAVKVSRTQQAEEALRQAAFESRLKAVMHVYEGKVPASDLPEDNNESTVYEARFSPDGKYVVTASGDATPRVWEAQTGKLVAKMEGNKGAVRHAEFSPDARLILTAGESGVRLWDAKTGKPVREVPHFKDEKNDRDEKKEYVTLGTFSPDGRYILTAGSLTANSGGTARVWETDTGRPVAVMRGHKWEIRNAVFSPDGKYVATASLDRTARVWEALTGKPVTELSGHRDEVQSVAFSPDGKLVVTASWDNTARVWESATGLLVAELRGHTGAVFSAVFSPSGEYVLTAGEDGSARIWEARTGKVIADLRAHTAALTEAVFSPDGRYIVTSSIDRTARVWETSFPLKGEEKDMGSVRFSLKEGMQVRVPGIGVLRGHADALLSATFSPDGEYIATTSTDGTARVWEASFPHNLEQLHALFSKVKRVAFSRDGVYMTTNHRDGYVRVWNAHTGRKVDEQHYDGRYDDNAAEFSPGGRFFTTSTGGIPYVRAVGTWRIVPQLEDLRIGGFSFDDQYALASNQVFETKTWNKVFDVPEVRPYFAPGGKFIAATFVPSIAEMSSKKEKTLIREVGTWRVVAESSEPPVSFSPDGELFLTRASDKEPTEQVWETRTGRWLAELPEGGDVWSPNGKLIVSIKEGLEVRVWEARTGRKLAELAAYAHVKESERKKHTVNGIDFSLDSKYLVTASNDTTARIWEAATGKEVRVFRDHRKAVNSAEFSPDGSLVVTAGDDAKIRVWEAATGLGVTEYRGTKDGWAWLSPDGKNIVLEIASDAKRVYFCDACYSLEDLLSNVRSHITRSLTSDERKKYLHQGRGR
jgi:WD40 repeat protein